MEQNLYLVQDSDRPMYVVAENWNTALEKWKAKVKEENDGEIWEDCMGIQFVASSSDLIL